MAGRRAGVDTSRMLDREDEMPIDEDSAHSDATQAPAEGTPWEDRVFDEPAPPRDLMSELRSFGDTMPPPQIVRTVNVIPFPEHRLAEDDVAGIADFLLKRAREGIADILSHDDYAQFTELAQSTRAEAFARKIAEHQTGIPYTQPAYFYGGGQKAVAAAIAAEGRYPLAGQCQQSVTTALCIGGWDGGIFGDIGSGIAAQPFCARLGNGWSLEDLKARSRPSSSGLALADWHDDLWHEIRPGTCLFWSAPCPITRDGETCDGSAHVLGCGQGSGHVSLVLRKHPIERQWQLWDTTTSFTDPAPHAAAQKGARMLWESHWWAHIPETMQGGNWLFRGLARIDGLGVEAPASLAPRGRCRLLLRRRSDHALLYRSDWISMESEGLPISWLLRSMRGAPHCDELEPTWCINSPGDAKKPPLPLLDCTCDANGNAKMSWVPDQGSHRRPIPRTIWDAPGRYPDAGGGATRPPPPAPGALRNAPLAGHTDLEAILAGHAAALHRGSRGEGVRAVQDALMKLDYGVPGGADGVFGKGVEAAIKTFQEANGLGVDGKVGKGTLKALDDALDG
ncbi:peptidoglycan-binding domain-containing protein [Sorangium sp. So ce117]|uniref:peptidoglycan-binding domain-containing protein n=1 Tax=Sorangium sp. So ce117 TaxID=3133277 RepID=UPI003F62D39E